MSKTRKPKRPSDRPRAYDLEMIQDFLQHLLWEVRISHHESQCDASNPINPELVDQLEKYIKKRQTAGLLYTVGFEEQVAALAASEPEKFSRFKQVQAELRKTQLIYLESLLRSLFPEAFDAAKDGRKLIVHRFKTMDDAIALYENSLGLLSDLGTHDEPSADDDFGTDDDAPPPYDDGYPKDDGWD